MNLRHPKSSRLRSLTAGGLVACLVVLSTGCDGSSSKHDRYDKVSRADFNRAAVRANLPVFWVADKDGDRAVDPNEVQALLFYPTHPSWTKGTAFTPAFRRAYATIVATSRQTPTDPRLKAVAKDLDAGVPTLVRSDLTGLSDSDQSLVTHIMRAGDLVDDLFDTTSGAARLEGRVGKDPISQSLFRRDRGFACANADAHCSAVPGGADLVADAYPAALQAHKNFCQELAKRADGEALLSPFTVVRRVGGRLHAVPYTKAYEAPMKAIADELELAAGATTSAADTSLVRYLHAAATAFRTNNWEPADEAWVAMNAKNSRWYLRVAPDETYSDPCSRKATFHLTFARINQGSLASQKKLAPVRQAMENQAAALAGKPYRARSVSFHLPDFIDIVANYGDDRYGLGGTTGQSLPNWGTVADEGRGRTVIMTNLYTDADSLAAQHAQAASLFDAASMRTFVDSAAPAQFGTVLHEATHNLGPGGTYRVRGKMSEDIFGGPLASVLEEAKAETGGLSYLEYLRKNGFISTELAEQTYTAGIFYALTQIANGMYYDGDADPYAQLSAIEIGSLMDHGALTWNATTTAANGRDRGAFTLYPEKLARAYAALIRTVLQTKARGDVASAHHLVARYVDGSVVPQKVISDRVQRKPRAAFVYSVLR